MDEDRNNIAPVVSSGSSDNVFDRISIYIWSRWWGRYALGIAFFVAAAWFYNMMEPVKADTLPYFREFVSIALVLWGLYCMKEVALWGLILIVVLWIGQIVAGLPVSVAIIIGAIIIAIAIYARRSK